MFPFLRFSAVMASIVVASTAFGFGLGSALSQGGKPGDFRSIDGNSAMVSTANEVFSGKSRSLARLRDFTFASATQDVGSKPAVNSEGPRPGSDHVDLGSGCDAASYCEMAMN